MYLICKLIDDVTLLTDLTIYLYVFLSYSRELAVDNIARFNTARGGLFPATTNVMYTHGQLDPTRTVGVQTQYHDSSPVLVINGKMISF